jgi:hypothetical protein
MITDQGNLNAQHVVNGPFTFVPDGNLVIGPIRGRPTTGSRAA